MTKDKKPTFTMKAVKSSQIAKYGYDTHSKTLAIEFSTGQTYHYHGVEQASMDGFAKAESPGKFLQSHIVGKFKHKRL